MRGRLTVPLLFSPSSRFSLSARDGACLSSPTLFLSTPSLLFSPIFEISSRHLRSLPSLSWARKAAEKPEDLMGAAVLPLAARGREEMVHILAVIIPVPLSSWSSGLMPGKGWHRPYLSAPDPAAVQPRSFRRSTALRGFQGRVARKLSQFIPRLWSDLSKTKPEGAVHVIF